MKINNTKVEVPATIDLNDKDYMTRCLTYLKDLEKNYTVALTEASNEELYNKYFNQFQILSHMQRVIYELMFSYGWYELQTANSTDINSKYSMLNKELNTLD